MLKNKISIIGLGYVGLPLSLEFGKKFKVIGFDSSKSRIDELKKFKDVNFQTTRQDFSKAKYLKFSNNFQDLNNSTYFIITVPTPINKKNKPDLSNIINATKLVGKFLKKKSIVIYESTVFPGCTEEVCVPILEKQSNLKYNEDFFCGYSPERINVGDKRYSLTNLKKITSGSTIKIGRQVDNLYKSIIKAGTYLASNIKIAEAAKVIENTQRDLNIALINELAIIFNRLKLDTEEVLDAAATKWNFVKYKPGLVGGHCIGVDPYYLTFKSKELGYNPKIILTGRKLNNSVSKYIAKRIKYLIKLKNIPLKNRKCLILGCTFKKNCSDTRNSKVFDLIKNLKSIKAKIEIYDPWINPAELKKDYKIKFIKKLRTKKKYNILILAVSHDKFKYLNQKGPKIFCKNNHIIYDVKSFFKKEFVDERL